jgi:DNA (cytosine-5)-methyltransferase 1
MVIALDLFAGPGGWDEGVSALGIVPLGIELEPNACKTREAAGHRTVQGNVAGLNPSDFAPCDLLIGSPPCQAFSAAGKGDGHRDVPLIVETARALAKGNDVRAAARLSAIDTRSLLVVEPLRYALVLRPRWVALEQVPTVLPIWRLFAELLREHGYRVWSGLLSAEQFGVPQTRQRAFLLADAEQQPHPPTPTHQAYEYGAPAAEQHTLEGTLLPWVSMAGALGWGMSERPSVTVTAQANRSGGIAPLDGGSGARETLRRERRDGRWFDRRQGNTLPDGSRQMVRLVPDSEPAPTISAGTGNLDRWVFDRPATTIAGDRRVFQPGGHHEPGQQSENAIPVTLEEAAVLQGFRADYPWQGDTNKQRFQQVGNAVPPPLARAVVAALVDVAAIGEAA